MSRKKTKKDSQQKEHVCDKMPSPNYGYVGEVAHVKTKDYKISNYGAAITSIVKLGNIWVAENGEYCTQIFHCPWCGQKLD